MVEGPAQRAGARRAPPPPACGRRSPSPRQAGGGIARLIAPTTLYSPFNRIGRSMAQTYLPTLKQLQYLVALHDAGHFGRAAEACFVTQSTLSAGLREL